jgi:phosphoribosyl 1,2-cyclic phosphate phosphodiesterase
VQINDTSIIIDFGADLGDQLTRNKIKHIDYAFLTHAHEDHYRGDEQFVRAPNCIMEAPAKVLTEYKKRSSAILNYASVHNPTFTAREFTKKTIDGVEIDSIKLSHEKDIAAANVACYGYKFTAPNFSFAYCTDCTVPLEPEKLSNLDLLIYDGTGMEANQSGHAGVLGAVQIYNQYKPKQMLLTHIRHTTEHNELLEFLRPHGNIQPAYDGLQLVID